MEDEIVKVDRKAADYAARAAKAKATKEAKKAADAKFDTMALDEFERTGDIPTAETVTRKFVQKEHDEEAAARGGSRLNSKTGRIEVVGRDGEVLSRSSTYVTDSFEIPKNLWPKGWSYQWNTISVHGNADVARDQMNLMQAQGWRAVPAERYAGTLLPRNAKGSIVRGGVILEERPEALTIEATAEDVANARKLISDRNESLKLASVQKSMPEGFVSRNDVSGIRMQIDKSLDVAQVNQESGRYTLDK